MVPPHTKGSEAIIELQNISFAYNVISGSALRVLSEANLVLFADQIICVLGESGSGKTTLLNLISGILSPTDGIIKRNKIAVSYLLQDDLLLPFRTVWQNSLLAAELQNSLSSNLFTEGQTLLRLFRLERFSERLPSELSGGMRRRVALARQLLINFDLLLLDEPFSSQDRGMRQILEDAVQLRCRGKAKTALIATHDIDSAVALADRIVNLNSKKQLQDAWTCPEFLSPLQPTERRAQSEFADHVADVWRSFWETSGRG